MRNGMNYSEYEYPSSESGHRIHALIWNVPTGVKTIGVVQIVHGMAEHIQRYDEFATFLAQQGYIVFGNDHLGHGKTADPSEYGFIAETYGWYALVKDVLKLKNLLGDKMKSNNPKLKYFMLGHSMGSFIARDFAAQYGTTLDGAIFCGTAGDNIMTTIAERLAKLEILRIGRHTPSNLLNDLSFVPYNRKFLPARTKFDWICSDETVVDKYVADEMCGFTFTAAAFRDLYHGLNRIKGRKWATKLPKKLPIYFIAGEDDPVGDYGKEVKQLAAKLQRYGLQNVTITIYPGVRHEILNDVSKLQVFDDVLGWLQKLC